MKRFAGIFLSSLAAIVVLSAGAWVLYTYPPAEHAFYPRCVFKTITGLECPGCGSTRAAHALLHGRIGEAFRLNPFIFVFGGVIAFALPSLVRGRQPEFMTTRWFAWTSAVVILGWWIARNL